MLDLEHLTRRFGATPALDDVSLAVDRGAIVCLLGPSGSGKSTLLRLVAGIEQPDSGRVLIDGAEVSGPGTFVEPEARRVGMVFQDYALFPHLTVAANVAFGARGRERECAELIERLGLMRLAGQFPHMLSGGERQRVALARAMAPQPRILLMDEPFSSLDTQLRERVRRETLEFLREAATTTVIVTHDPFEALRVADKIALLEAGRLVQYGTPAELYDAPRSLFAARLFGDVAAVPGQCRDGRIETALGAFAAEGMPRGAGALACIRPEHVALADTTAHLVGRVVNSVYCGGSRELRVAVDGLDAPLVVRVARGDPSEKLETGALVHLGVRDRGVPVIAI